MNFDNYIIKPISKGDIPSYFSFFEVNRNRLSKYFPKTVSSTKDLESTTTFVVNNIGLWEKKELLSFVIIDTVTQKIIGSVFLKDFNWTVLKVETGFFIDKNYEGKGVITKAVSLIIAYCFQELKLNKLFMRIAEANISSRRVTEKNGFLLEGKLRQDFKTDEGQFIDVLYYGLLKEK